MTTPSFTASELTPPTARTQFDIDKFKRLYHKLESNMLSQLSHFYSSQIDSRITHHEDFYDMGAMIYQHVPVLGWAVKKINSRLVSA